MCFDKELLHLRMTRHLKLYPDYHLGTPLFKAVRSAFLKSYRTILLLLRPVPHTGMLRAVGLRFLPDPLCGRGDEPGALTGTLPGVYVVDGGVRRVRIESSIERILGESGHSRAP